MSASLICELGAKIDAELALMEAAYKEAASSPEKAVAFLKEVGLLDENGKLAPEFRD